MIEILVVRVVFHDNNKYYLPVFLCECLNKSWKILNVIL